MVKKKLQNPFFRWLIIQYIAVIIASMMGIQLSTSFAVHGVDLQTERHIQFHELLFSLPIISAILFFTNYLISNKLFHYLNSLTTGIEQLANGQFDIQLNEKKAGPYRRLFKQFNTMAKELKGTKLLREDFINHFSHEFKTPIAAINGFAQLLNNPNTTPEEQQQYIRIITEESQRLTTLSQNILLLSSLENQHIVYDKQDFNLTQQIKQCTITLLPKINQKKIELKLDLQDIKYHSNPDLLFHIWNNLLDNAIKYTPEGGIITINLYQTSKQILFSISNSGPGIAPENIETIFKKFYQEKHANAKDGLGLGLNIVARILTLVKGEISVESNVNKETTFSIFLPINSSK